MGVIAQLPSKIHTVKVSAGTYVALPLASADTLISGDTIAYVFQIEHSTNVDLSFDVRNKIVANDTSVAVTFWESLDGITYYAVLAGSTPSAYTKTIAKGAGNTSWVCASDYCWFGMRYLKVMFIAKPKTGFKKIFYGYLKTNLR
jgi:hypothetical protein